MTHYSSIRTVFETVDTALTQISLLRNVMVHEATHRAEVYFLAIALIVVLFGVTNYFERARDRALVLIGVNWIVEKGLYAVSLHYVFDVFWLRCIFILMIVAVHYMSYLEYNKKQVQIVQDIL